MGVKDKIEITIRILIPSISDIHETISSILEQSNLSSFDISVYLINQTNLDVQTELARLSEHNIHITNAPSNTRFFLSLNAGEVISRSYLYKGYHYLLNNSSALVCPEYTFRRIENTLVITTIKNDQMLCNQTSANFVDRQKLSKTTSTLSPRVSIVKDTCVALNTLDIDFYQYVHQTKKTKPFFDSPLFAIQNYTNITKPQLFLDSTSQASIKQKTISLLKTSAGRSKILKKLLKSSREDQNTIHSKTPPYISPQMRNEIEQLSAIKYGLKGYMAMKFVDLTYETFLKSEQLFSIYCKVMQHMDYTEYSYIMILPWLISGGIDLFAVNYLKTMAKLQPNQNILVILTNNAHCSFTKEQLGLSNNITLIDLPKILQFNQTPHKLLIELVYSIINNFQPQRLHNIASKVGYDCLIKYGDIIRKRNTKVLFSSYNYLTGPHGEYMGYSVQELPIVYRPGDIVTTDNSASKKLWVEHFGFIPQDILVHHQLFDCSQIHLPAPTTKDGMNILWAAHIRPEKNPDIVPAIAEALQTDKISIDCYGLFSSQNWEDGENPLEANISNLHYKGPYNSFFKDINLAKYDLFLYTSHADGTPNVIIEAALAGLPIVSSRIGGIPDALENNAELVNDTHSPEEFIQAIRKTLSSLDSSRNKASELQKKLIAKHNEKNFTNQVKEMLKRTNP